MPLFLKNKFVFLHIPKTGGSSIIEQFKEKGDNPLFYSEAHFINGHSQQHSTYIELLNWKLIPEDFEVFTVVRHPYERFVSEYNYRYKKQDFPTNLQEFLNEYLNSESKYEWDNHNKPHSYFLKDSENVKILRFENLKKDFKNLTGWELTKHELNKEKIITLQDLTDKIKERIYSIWEEDFINYGYER